jgi:hypothetical protein
MSRLERVSEALIAIKSMNPHNSSSSSSYASIIYFYDWVDALRNHNIK